MSTENIALRNEAEGMISFLHELAANIIQEFAPADMPKAGQVWIYDDEEVTITRGWWRIDDRISNYWWFEYADGRTGGAYNNNRQKFHPKVSL